MFFKMPFKVRNIEIHANLTILLLPNSCFSWVTHWKRPEKQQERTMVFDLIDVLWQILVNVYKRFCVFRPDECCCCCC